jgi:hypothetical protein
MLKQQDGTLLMTNIVNFALSEPMRIVFTYSSSVISAVEFWNYLQIDWIQNDDLQVVIYDAHHSFGKLFFMEVLILACRGIWLVRNYKIFNQVRPTFTKWKHKFIHDMSQSISPSFSPGSSHCLEALFSV